MITLVLTLSIFLNAILLLLCYYKNRCIRLYRVLLDVETKEKERYKEHLFTIIKRAINKSISDDRSGT